MLRENKLWPCQLLEYETTERLTTLKTKVYWEVLVLPVCLIMVIIATAIAEI